MEAYVSSTQVKFHIISRHRLSRSCGAPDAASLYHLNGEQLMKALTSLFNLYEANRSSNSMSQNEAEFYSFYLLLHLGRENQVLLNLLVTTQSKFLHFYMQPFAMNP